MINILKDGIGYVTIAYNDGTKKVIRTTLNQEFLENLGIYDLKECLYDLDRQELVELTGSLEITKEFPRLDEFNELINKYL